MNWHLSHRFDRRALPLADRHYNRRKVGSPQFVPPGMCVVLLTADAGALWVSSAPFAEYVKHAWPGAWVNSCFRRESGPLASELIEEAVMVTRYFWLAPVVRCPYCDVDVSIVSFIDSDKVRRKRDYGRCYIKAGWTRCKGKTKGGLVVVHLPSDALPRDAMPAGYREQPALFQERFMIASNPSPAVPGGTDE